MKLGDLFTPNAVPAPEARPRDGTQGCGTCTYWSALKRGPPGYCLRLPPQVVALPPMSNARASTLNAVTCWPLTLADHWCGEHVAATAAA